MMLQEHELPTTREGVTAWALTFSDGFSWQNIDSGITNIVTDVNVILRWVCNDLATVCPDVITMDYRINHYGALGTQIKVAGIAVAGGVIPSKGLISYAVRSGIPIRITNHSKYKCTSELKNENYLVELGLAIK